ncbi:conserved hypothetical protein [Cellvibrio japonicus Ueda107]|uniref:Gylcosyl hydrolase 115 C-terminal domain-containing protein n=2 Tax=Cellvibrio japonicus TaxID=155077 RepID=B3PDB0_CELJU|nr:conserved hypothetical protein [Cellvibrio japonicus Ueda107]
MSGSHPNDTRRFFFIVATHRHGVFTMTRQILRQPLWLVFFFLVTLFSSAGSLALGEDSWLTASSRGGQFVLVGNKTQASLYIDSNDFSGAQRSARHLQQDIAKVSGKTLALIQDASQLSGTAVIMGTIGKSALIDRLIAEGELDVSDIRDQWDAYHVQVLKNPLPHIKQALVIAGSNKRGTSYGIYSLSEQIGVSPWYWWADVPIKTRPLLFINKALHLQDQPRVKYRGIFLNDEAPALTNWVKEKYGDYNASFYEKVFELLLRLKANFLWPAMWNNAFADDDPQNMILADDYGIVMSTSHHEPMMRADKEWNRYGKGPWEYSTNPDNLYQFWVDGAKRNKPYESIYTLGMRGQEDEPMSEGENIDLLERIVRDQRKIIADVFGQEQLTQVPQVWALYKEVQGFYERGMRVPEDVILLWCDDNWGNIRRLPTPEERRRRGGAGVYYHFDYVGGPRSYRWINSVSTAKIWEQMHLAYTYDANKIWVVNVGDLKPMEYPIEFFLRMAWNPEAWPKERIPEFGKLWAEREFGKTHAQAIARIVDGYSRHNLRRKPELQDAGIYHQLHYREADRVTAEIKALAQEAEALYQQLPTNYRDAFYQLVLHPTAASAVITEMYDMQAKNQLYAQQGRASANRYAEKVRELFAADEALTQRYHQLNNGKWNHMMAQTRIGYTHWNNPPANTLPLLYDYQPHGAADMGVAIEGMTQAWPAPGQYELPRFDPYGQSERYIDIFNKGKTPFTALAKTSAPWIIINNTSMQVKDEQRLQVSIDWSKVPKGQASGNVQITGTGWGGATIKVNAFNPALRKDPKGFVEGDGYIAIEAEHFARRGGNTSFRWDIIPQHGRTLSSISPYPITDYSFEEPAKAPYVEYDLYLFQAGDVEITGFFAPSLAFFPGRGLRYAISLNGEKPQIVDIVADMSEQAWEESVKRDIRTISSRHRVDRAGPQTLRIYMVDPGVSLQKVVINTGGLKPSYLGPTESRRY